MYNEMHLELHAFHKFYGNIFQLFATYGFRDIRVLIIKF